MIKIKFKILLPLIVVFFIDLLQAQVIVSQNQNLANIIEKTPAGSTILIKYGIYKVNNIIIDKPLTLIGENYPTIEGNLKDEVITIKSSKVKIIGLKITNAGVSFLKENAAIRLEEVSDCIIENNILKNNFFGIYISKSFNCVIRNNKIEASNKLETTSGNGIHLWYCKSITIENNEIKGHRDGIYFEFVRHSLVINNYSSNNLRYGLHFMFSDSCSYIKNTFEQNGAGVAVMYTRNVTMKENKFINNWGAASFGVLLKDLNDCLIEKNLFEKNTNGLYLEGCNRITVRQNNFINNGWGIKLMANSMDNFFFDNNFISNSFDVLTNSRNNFNTFSRNFWNKYDGFDLNKDGFGDIAYRPVKMFSVIVERKQASLILIHSLFVEVLNIAESILPSLTPENLIDKKPRMYPYKIETKTFFN